MMKMASVSGTPDIILVTLTVIGRYTSWTSEKMEAPAPKERAGVRI